MSMKMLVGVQHVVIMFTVGQLMCAGYTFKCLRLSNPCQSK